MNKYLGACQRFLEAGYVHPVAKLSFQSSKLKILNQGKAKRPPCDKSNIN